MNLHAKFTTLSPPRPAGPMRRRFTIHELLAMEETGILHPDERVELIDGDIITMPAKGNRHEDMRTLLAGHFGDEKPKDIMLAQEPAFNLSDYYNPEPDIVLFPRSLLSSQVRGDSALLVVEVAVSSLSYDMKIKAPRYAAHRVREYWVVDAKRLVTYVHREPGPEGYASIREVPANERIEPLLVPSVTLALADLGLEPLADSDEADAAT